MNNRTRVTMACDECARQHLKCDGKYICDKCIIKHKRCTYNRGIRKRGRKNDNKNHNIKINQFINIFLLDHESIPKIEIANILVGMSELYAINTGQL